MHVLGRFAVYEWTGKPVGFCEWTSCFEIITCLVPWLSALTARYFWADKFRRACSLRGTNEIFKYSRLDPRPQLYINGNRNDHSGPHLLIKISYLYPLCQCSLSTATRSAFIIKWPPSGVSLHQHCVFGSFCIHYLCRRYCFICVKGKVFNGEIFLIIIIRKMWHFSGSSDS